MAENVLLKKKRFCQLTLILQYIGQYEVRIVNQQSAANMKISWNICREFKNVEGKVSV